MKKSLFYSILIGALFAFAFSSCKEDDPVANPMADFGFELDEQNPLIVAFTNKSNNAETYSWNFGDNSEPVIEESPTHIFPKDGEYNVKLTAIGIEGSIPSVKELKVTITGGGFQCVEVEGNLIQGGAMEKSCAEFWTVAKTHKSDLTYEFGKTTNLPTNAEGGALAIVDPATPYASTMDPGSIIYQRINLTAGKYRFSADFRSSAQGTNPGELNNFWFEIILDKKDPAPNSADYGGQSISFMHAWSGTPAPAINGNIVTVLNKSRDEGGFKFEGALADENGEFDITEAGTYTFGIKAGRAWDSSFGIGFYIDNVKLVKVN